MNALTNHAIAAIKTYRTNKIIMDFLTSEAREKVASEIREEMKGGTTAKAVELMEIRYSNIKQRVEDYVTAGLVGCYMAAVKQQEVMV